MMKKSYCLENLKNSKLIIFQDVQLFEDNLLSKLTIVDISMPTVFVNIIGEFVDDVLAKDKNIITES